MMAIIRQGHKWIALILGIQLALWMLSGLGMAILPHSKVVGHHHKAAPAAPTPLSELACAEIGQPDALDIEPCGDLRHIPVLRTPRQNFIADDDQGGGPGAVGIRHGAVIAVPARPA